MKKEYRKGDKVLRIIPIDDEYQITCDDGYKIATFFSPVQKSYLLGFLMLKWLKMSKEEVLTIMGVIK